MAKIFISYNRTSQHVVERLVQDLKDDDHEIWFDQQLTGGQIWWDKILSEIRECEIFVAVLTPDSLESQACRRELKYAFDLQKPLLPVRLSDKVQSKSLPHDLGERQFVDYIRQEKKDLKNLQRALKALPRAPSLPDPLPEPPAVPISDLITLREQVETESKLELNAQAALVLQLRRRYQDGRPAKEIIDLLQRLKKRGDLDVNVFRDIDQLLADMNRGQQGSLFRSSLLAMGCFLSYFVNILNFHYRYIDLSRATDLNFIRIASFAGVVFSVSAIYYFIRIGSRSPNDIRVLGFALILGCLNGMIFYIHMYIAH